MIRFAGRNHAVKVLRIFTALLQNFPASPGRKRSFRFVFGCIRHGHNSGTFPQLSGGHAKCLIYFFRRNNAGTKFARGTGQINILRVQDLSPFVRWPSLSSAPASIPDETTFVFHHPAPRVSFPVPKQNSYFTVAAPAGRSNSATVHAILEIPALSHDQSKRQVLHYFCNER